MTFAALYLIVLCLLALEGSMLLKFVFAWALLVSLSLAVSAGDAREGDGLDGTWLPVEAELAGKQFPYEVRKSMKLVIKEGQYTVTVGKMLDKGTVKVNTTAKRRAMDIMGTDGPNKGKMIPAIYEHDGDTLKICYDLSGKKRPTEFKTEAGTQLFLVTYKRDKP